MKAKQNYTAERFETVKEICRWSAERYFDKTMFLCKCKGMYQPMSYEWFGNWMNGSSVCGRNWPSGRSVW